MSRLCKVFEPTVAAFKRLGQQYAVINVEKLHGHCDELESRWREVRTVLPQRITAVREEIDVWIEFDERLEELQLWLEGVQEMCEQWKVQENSTAMIENLEVSFAIKFVSSSLSHRAGSGQSFALSSK